MTNVTLFEKARQGRRTALASLGTREHRTDNVVSIFDQAFDDVEAEAPATGTNVIAFRTARKATAALALDQRIAA